MSAHTLDDVMTRVPQLPALPKIVARIVASLEDDSLNTDTLAELVEADPAISMRLLAAASSAAFGAHGTTSVRQALMRLGIARVRQIVVATALFDRYKLPLPFDCLRLWRHSLAVALCAEDIARYAGLHAETAYMAGLLHDVGQLLMFVADPVDYSEILRQQIADDRPLVEIERSRWGVDHAQVGRELARRWNLPGDIAESIGAHHARDARAPVSEFADVVHAATVLAHALDLGSLPNNAVPPVCDLCCARLGIDWRAFAPHFAGIEARYEGALLMLGI